MNPALLQHLLQDQRPVEARNRTQLLRERAGDAPFREEALQAYDLITNGRVTVLFSDPQAVAFEIEGYPDLKVFVGAGMGHSFSPATVPGRATIRIESAVRASAFELANSTQDFSAVLLGIGQYEFVHEFTHYLDSKRIDRSQWKKSGTYWDDDTAYVNTPVEMNAFYQSTLAEFQREAADYIWYLPTLEARQQAFRERIGATPKDFLDLLQNTFEGWKLMSTDTKQRQLKRAYQDYFTLLDMAAV